MSIWSTVNCSDVIVEPFADILRKLKAAGLKEGSTKGKNEGERKTSSKQRTPGKKSLVTESLTKSLWLYVSWIYYWSLKTNLCQVQKSVHWYTFRVLVEKFVCRWMPEHKKSLSWKPLSLKNQNVFTDTPWTEVQACTLTVYLKYEIGNFMLLKVHDPGPSFKMVH